MVGYHYFVSFCYGLPQRWEMLEIISMDKIDSYDGILKIREQIAASLSAEEHRVISKHEVIILNYSLIRNTRY